MIIQKEIIQNNITKLSIVFESGLTYELLSLGASLSRWISKDGTELVAGYRDYEDYLQAGMYLGTCVGMNAGRIDGGLCNIEGTQYHFTSKANHYLHGGDRGINFVNFTISQITHDHHEAVIYFSTNFLHEFIGSTAQILIRYSLREDGFSIRFIVTTDKTTICNLTNHSYFNLDGDFAKDLSNHFLFVNASNVVAVNNGMIGTDILSVQNTPFDFTKLHPLMPAITNPSLKSQKAAGIDHFFILDKYQKPDLVLYSQKSRRRLEVTSTYPGITLYTTNYPTKKPLQKGELMGLHGAIAIEPQFQSNAVNDHRFTNYLLTPNETYDHTIEYCLKEDSLQ